MKTKPNFPFIKPGSRCTGYRSEILRNVKGRLPMLFSRTGLSPTQNAVDTKTLALGKPPQSLPHFSTFFKTQ